MNNPYLHFLHEGAAPHVEIVSLYFDKLANQNTGRNKSVLE